MHDGAQLPGGPTLEAANHQNGARRARRPPNEAEAPSHGAEIGLRYDMGQFYAMKATLEALFGRPVYMKLKESAGIADWRKAIIRLLDAIALAIESTITIADDGWREDIAAEIAHGKGLIEMNDTTSDLFASLSATLSRIVFLQIGLMPTRTALSKTVPLKADWWRLDKYRTAQYVQSTVQRRALDEARSHRKEAQSRPSD